MTADGWREMKRLSVTCELNLYWKWGSCYRERDKDAISQCHQVHANILKILVVGHINFDWIVVWVWRYKVTFAIILLLLHHKRKVFNHFVVKEWKVFLKSKPKNYQEMLMGPRMRAKLLCNLKHILTLSSYVYHPFQMQEFVAVKVMRSRWELLPHIYRILREHQELRSMWARFSGLLLPPSNKQIVLNL